ncbi:MAG: lipoyl(octanoyl) transferase LipB [Armatimonadetes bacterium]|nr:lipoyl(octanoyl) transferase LipB [Armatimonadota bacterium]
MTNKLRLIRLGLVPYQEALQFQEKIHAEVLSGAPDTLILLQHPPVLTLGASFHEQNLLFKPDDYARRGIEVAPTRRGGDVTYHGPGQQVAYPIFNLAKHKQDLHWYLRGLEEALIQTCGAFGLSARRFAPHTGVWIGDRKIAAIGIQARKWVSMHGIALNVENDLKPFQLIVPCGIQGYGVTSLTEELERHVSLEEAEPKLIQAFIEVFGFEGVGPSLAGEASLPLKHES